jgi:hypothetical protein
MCDNGACGHYCTSDKGLFDLKEINDSIKVGNGDTMMETKIGSRKCCAIQVNRSGIEIILHVVMFKIFGRICLVYIKL